MSYRERYYLVGSESTQPEDAEGASSQGGDMRMIRDYLAKAFWIAVAILGMIGIPYAIWRGWIVIAYDFLRGLVVQEVPIWCFASLLALALVGYLLYRLLRRGEPEAGPAIAFLSYPRYGYRDLGYGLLGGVKWLLQYPKPSLSWPPSEASPSELAASLNVDGPYCPRCETELVERKALFGYTWVCERCGLKLRRRMTMFEAEEQATRIFRADCRRQLAQEAKKRK